MILKISLRPQGKFFFGGESNFNQTGEEKKRRSTYVLHSRLFPQQTGALGLLRNQLLLQSGLLSDNTVAVNNKKQAELLIGKTGFRLNTTANDYGVIKRISSVFLQSADGELCPPAPLDDVIMKNKEVNKSMVFAQGEHQGNVPAGQLKNYREKQGVSTQFQHPTHGNLEVEELVTDQKRVGITKSARPWKGNVPRVDASSGYYCQIFRQFQTKRAAPDQSFHIKGFCFYAEIALSISDGNTTLHWSDKTISANEKDKYTLQPALVEFGGERSTFQMDVEVLDGQQDWTLPTVKYQNTTIENAQSSSVKRLVLLSPAFVPALSALSQATLLRVTKTLAFRFLQSIVSQTSTFQAVHRTGTLQPDTSALVESKLFQLLDRGSVLYFDTHKQSLVENLFDQPSFKAIGYNQYQII